MSTSDIIVKGAREHNLRNVNLTLPRNHLICFTGVSGSGKSSLAFDTLYAEGQRRYIESLSSYARQFLGQLPKPDADQITGLSPAISISQKAGGHNVRSTVGTVTEIYDFLRVLYARVSSGYCPKCGKPITAQTRQQIIDRIETLPLNIRFQILAPLVRGQRGEFKDLFSDLLKQGYLRARVDGNFIHLTDDLKLDRQMRHEIEVVIDRLVQTGIDNRDRLAETVEQALEIGSGNLIVVLDEDETQNKQSRNRNKSETETLASTEISFSADYACVDCGISFEPPSPQLFSFNTPRGMCPHCNGLGETHGFAEDLLIPDATKSFQQGCIEPIGKWKELGRWRRHIFSGVAETIEKIYNLPKDSVLETAWEELPEKVREILLWGTGDQHIVFTWKNGSIGHKWGGKYEGIIPKMLAQYEGTKSKMQKLAMEKYMRVQHCVFCKGHRLNEQARSFRIETASPAFKDVKRNLTLPEVCNLPINKLYEFFSAVNLSESGQIIAAELLKEIRNRIGFLLNVGLEYLSLGRGAPTLSGGEMQRIRLASQIGSGLTGVLYILDEPSIGLHPRDNERLISTLKKLRDLGNTVIVVEHDEDTMRSADTLVDFGPGPGIHGGEIVTNTEASITKKYLDGKEFIPIPEKRRAVDPQRQLIIRGATHNNLKNVDVAIPLGAFICITGVSGSGKSSLVNDILAEALNRDLNRGCGEPGQHKCIEGIEHLDKMIDINQSPIGRGSHSNPATYIKVFDEIRNLFSQLPEAKARGYASGRFSFNVRGGRCEACEGRGVQKLEMDFLADVYVTCSACEGRRFNHETLSVLYKGKSIDQVLNMDVEEALKHFENIPRINQYLTMLDRVGLGYMKLGQPSPTLSGGEAQRIKLARELVKRSTGKTLYLLDEPTTGLHFADINMLLSVLHEFVNNGNTVLVVEHNLDVIKTADWIIDMGPEGGEDGGYITAQGTPEDIMKCEHSYTKQALQRVFADRPIKSKSVVKKSGKATAKSKTGIGSIIIRGAEEHNLKCVSAEIPRNQITVCSGPSGSGKSSLAMDTIYAEGQRRYVESLSSYARQFIGQLQKPRVEHIEGLSPAIAIEQKTASHSPRSTVGTITEIQDYLRVLFARLGVPYCPHCSISIGNQTLDEIIAKILLPLENKVKSKAGKTTYAAAEQQRLLIAAPLNIDVGSSYEDLWKKIRSDGFSRVRINGKTYTLDEKTVLPEIDRRRKHSIELVIDRIVLKDEHDTTSARMRIADSVETALTFGKGVVHIIQAEENVPEQQWKRRVHSQHLACGSCGRSFERLSPHNFSSNSPLGWCPSCEGLGVQQGASPAVFLRDAKLTLAQGAVRLFPDTNTNLFQAMLKAFSEKTEIPIDVPFDQLDARFKRLIYHGTGTEWFACKIEMTNSSDEVQPFEFCFQYRGLYPAVDEAMRLVPQLRYQMNVTIEEVECGVCLGSRLRDDASAVRFNGKTMDQLARMSLANLLRWFEQWKPSETERQVSGDLIDEVKNRLRFLVNVGLDYITLGRGAPTLSGGEMQRIRLAAQIGSGLVSVLYVLDEPTIGLHPRDNQRLINALKMLRDLGNTLVVVEHDRGIIGHSDYVLDFGPKAGKNGGKIVAAGTPKQIEKQADSVTGPYLSGKKTVPIPTSRRITPNEAMECPTRN
ncbi:MAG: excinuclease ABC subunit UvrA [Planctomycetaceae bacterium]|nr:excinuclease ABC subunit UvrA [Planctomycetaceae bacterium]